MYGEVQIEWDRPLSVRVRVFLCGGLLLRTIFVWVTVLVVMVWYGLIQEVRVRVKVR